MHIDKLNYFIDLVENGSFTKTAKLNYVSQTTISQQIASLEQQYGLKLINREKTPVVPTEAGELFYREAKQVFLKYQSMNTHIEDFKNGLTTVNIDYTSIVDINILSEFVRKLTDDEHIHVNVKKVALSQLAENLESGQTDFAISVDSEFINHPKIETLVLYSGEYAAMVGDTHPFYEQNQLTKEQLYSLPLVMLSREKIGQSFDMMLERAEIEGFSPNIVREVDDSDEELFYIQTENLIGFFPETYPLDEGHPHLKLLPIKETSHDYKIVLAYLKKEKPLQVKKVIQHIRSHTHKKNQ